jgi:hypothetical protein
MTDLAKKMPVLVKKCDSRLSLSKIIFRNFGFRDF